jgi:hypothetical protein
VAATSNAGKEKSVMRTIRSTICLLPPYERGIHETPGQYSGFVFQALGLFGQ